MCIICLNNYILTTILRCSRSGGSLSFVGCFFGLLSSNLCFLCGALSFTCDVLMSIRILFHGPLLALETLFCILLFSLQGSCFTCFLLLLTLNLGQVCLSLLGSVLCLLVLVLCCLVCLNSNGLLCPSLLGSLFLVVKAGLSCL